MKKELISTAEAKKLTGLPKARPIRIAVKDGEIKGKVVNGRYYADKESLMEWFKQREKNA